MIMMKPEILAPAGDMECLNSVRVLMEKAIDLEILRIEPTVILENMDITEKVMYLDYLTETNDTKDEEEKKGCIF